MATRAYTKDSVLLAIKIHYRTDSVFELGFRVRTHCKEFEFTGTPEIFGALVLEVLL